MTNRNRLLVTAAIVGVALTTVGGNRGCDALPPIVKVAPIPADGLHVLVVEETEDRTKLPPSQIVALTSSVLRDYVAAKQGQFMMADDDSPIEHMDPLWAAALARPRTGLPWIIVSNGTNGAEQLLPQDIDATLELIRQYAEP